MDWEEAMKEAKRELGYSENQYVSDWDRLVQMTRDVLEFNKQQEYEDFCDEAYYKYREYLKSDRWKKLREEIMQRDHFTCQDCGKRARDVHHITYDYLGQPEEADYCVALCRTCHKKRHTPIPKKQSKKEDEDIIKIEYIKITKVKKDG